jgi:hypothetical protein
MSNFNLADNPNTSPEALERLANDVDLHVRLGFAWNRNTPPETLERLANDLSPYVRFRVEYNPATPQYIITYLKIKKFLNCYE